MNSTFILLSLLILTLLYANKILNKKYISEENHMLRFLLKSLSVFAVLSFLFSHWILSIISCIILVALSISKGKTISLLKKYFWCSLYSIVIPLILIDWTSSIFIISSPIHLSNIPFSSFHISDSNFFTVPFFIFNTTSILGSLSYW